MECTRWVELCKTARLSGAFRQFCLSYNLIFNRHGPVVMPLLKDRRWAVAFLFMIPALWSVNYLVGRLAQGLIAPHMLALLRWSLAGLVLALFAWPELWAKKSSLLKNSWHFVVLGALGMWICGAWVYIGAESTSATNIALIYTLSPVFIALVSTVWLRERLGLTQWLGIGLAFVGLVHVVIRGQWAALAEVRLVAVFHFAETLAI